MQTVRFPTEESSEAAKKSLYLDELDRQAEMGSEGLARAIEQGLRTPNGRDPAVWSALQSALFACIVVARILRPTRPRGTYPGLSSNDTRRYAERRGEELRQLLEIDENSPLFSVTPVRDAFEHYDERLDAHLVDGAACLSDWYISDGDALMTPPNQQGQMKAVGLRVFFPAGGLVFFDTEPLDLFQLDVALLDLRIQIMIKRKVLRSAIRGRGIGGGHQVVHLASPDVVERRYRQWHELRATAGQSLAADSAAAPASPQAQSN